MGVGGSVPRPLHQIECVKYDVGLAVHHCHTALRENVILLLLVNSGPDSTVGIATD